MHEQVPLMTEAVRDASFWEYLGMLLRVARVIDHLEHWMEACPCHFKAPDNSDPLYGNKAFRTRYSCPMAGRRAPELAAGCLDELVKNTFRQQHTELLTACSALTHEQRNKILRDFASGQARLEQFFVLKFAFWKSLPHKICLLGHFSEDVARAGLQEAADMFREHADSDQHHPLTRHVFQGAVAEDVQGFLEGRISRSDSNALMREAAACSFIACVERSIEARHALLKAKTAIMKRINPATFALAIRAHELYRRCFRDKGMLRDWESHVGRVKRCPKKGLPDVLVHVGFSQHPEVLRLIALGAVKIKIKAAATIVYHCDLGMQYNKQTRAARTLQQPKYRDNPDDAQKVRRHIANQEESDQDKRAAMLRVLMLEDFRTKCREGHLYSVRGVLQPTRLLRDALVPSVAAPEPRDAALQNFATPDPETEPGFEVMDVQPENPHIVCPAAAQTSVFLQAGKLFLRSSLVTDLCTAGSASGFLPCTHARGA